MLFYENTWEVDQADPTTLTWSSGDPTGWGHHGGMQLKGLND